VTIAGTTDAQQALTVRNGAAGTIYFLADPSNARVLVGNSGRRSLAPVIAFLNARVTPTSQAR